MRHKKQGKNKSAIRRSSTDLEAHSTHFRSFWRQWVTFTFDLAFRSAIRWAKP